MIYVFENGRAIGYMVGDLFIAFTSPLPIGAV